MIEVYVRGAYGGYIETTGSKGPTTTVEIHVSILDLESLSPT